MTNTPEKILAVKLAGLGDLLLCEPALRSLRGGFPNAAIDVLTTPEAADLLNMFDGQYNLRTIEKDLFDSMSLQTVRYGSSQVIKLLVQLRKTGYDLIVLFHHLTTQAGVHKYRALVRATGCNKSVGLDNGRGRFLSSTVIDAGFGALHETDYMLAVARKAGGMGVDPNPKVVVNQINYQQQIARPYIAIYPVTGVYSNARNWRTSKFSVLGQMLSDEGFNIVLVGGNDAVESAKKIQQDLPTAFDLTGKSTIEELAAILQDATVAVGADTFAGHLAAAVKTPTVSIFGPSNHEAWRPYGSVATVGPQFGPAHGFVVTENLPCSPCLYSGYLLGRPAGCPDRTCIKNISVEKVYNATMTLLRNGS